MVSIERSILELNRMFPLLNEKYFNNTLETPVITIESGGTKSNVLGFYSSQKEWKDTRNNSYYQITICSEHLDRGVQDICYTLLHEMVHLYCSMNNIPPEVERTTTRDLKRLQKHTGLLLALIKD